MDPEDDYVDGKFDEYHIADQGHMNPALYDFVDYTMVHDAHENFDDIVEQKIFKYKYRQNADDPATFEMRQTRMRDRMIERAKHRDPTLEQDLFALFASDARDNSTAQLAVNPQQFRDVAGEETRPFREYMVTEAMQ